MTLNPMTVLRVQKLKSWGSIAGSGSHNNRTRPTHNARAERLDQNVYLIGQRGDHFADLVRTKIGDQTIRKNAVLAFEVVMSASPSYFRPDAPEAAGAWDEQRFKNWQQASLDWLRQKYGDRIISAITHLDEQTPHLHALVVPLDDKGKLNCRALLGGSRQTLRDLQTSYANAVKHLGIERGKEGSKAQHVTVSEYYAAANAARTPILPAVKTPPPGPEPIEPTKPGFLDSKENKQRYAQDHAQWTQDKARWELQRKQYANESIAQRNAAVQVVPSLQAKASKVEQLEQQVLQLKEENSRLLKERAQLKEQAARMRALPLDAVLTKMYGADENGTKPGHKTRKFKLPDGTSMAITDDLWKNNSLDKGGKGSLNLVMHLEGFGQDKFGDAVRMLSEHFDSADVLAQIGLRTTYRYQKLVEKQPYEPYPAPTPNSNTWIHARRYLIDTRCIPAQVVDAAHAAGLVFSDERSNLVFVREKGGCFKRGSYDPEGRPAFKQTLGRAAGPFVLPGDGQLIICEGSIDALTLKAMHADATVIATGGNLPEQFLTPWLSGASSILLAQDNDQAGDNQASTIASSTWISPGVQVERYRPIGAKDWNGALQQDPSLLGSEGIQPPVTPPNPDPEAPEDDMYPER